jgi:hypothetical protein
MLRWINTLGLAGGHSVLDTAGVMVKEELRMCSLKRASVPYCSNSDCWTLLHSTARRSCRVDYCSKARRSNSGLLASTKTDRAIISHQRYNTLLDEAAHSRDRVRPDNCSISIDDQDTSNMRISPAAFTPRPPPIFC